MRNGYKMNLAFNRKLNLMIPVKLVGICIKVEWKKGINVTKE